MDGVPHNQVVIGAVTGARAVTYARQSKGYLGSIDDQEREMLEVCTENDWTVVANYRDKISASRHETRKRADWAKITKAIEAGDLDVLVTWEISRADRDVETWFPFLSTCRRMGVRIHIKSAEITYNPSKAKHWKDLAQGGLDAAAEVEVLRERSLRGLAGALRAGKQHGPAHYGFDRRYDSKDRKKFTEVPNGCMPVAVEIITRVAEAEPLIHIERDLNGTCTVEDCEYVRPGGIPTPGGGQRWYRSTIRRIASNPAYIGMRRGTDGQLHPGNWDGTLDESVFDDAQEVLRDPKRTKTRPGRQKWLLSYLVATPCGGQVHGALGGGVYRKRQRHPSRHLYHCVRNGCVGIGTLELDEYVTRAVLARLVLPETRMLFERSDEEAEAARAELAKLAAELDGVRQSWLRPGSGISDDDYVAKKAVLEPLIEEAKKRTLDVTTPPAVHALLSDGEFSEETARPRWEKLSVPAKRSVINAVVERMEVSKSNGKRLSRWSTDEDRLLAAEARTTIVWRQPKPLSPDPRDAASDAGLRVRAA